MSVDIFRLDWILIDSIIIFLLLILFVAVKLFKWKNRWRSELSNIFLKQENFKSKEIVGHPSNPLIKGLNIIYSESISGKRKNMLFIRNRRDNLTQILMEAMATYGYNVLELIFESKEIYGDIKDLYLFLRSFLKSRKEINSFVLETYVLINQAPLSQNFDPFLLSNIPERVILLNPKTTEIFLRMLQSKDLLRALLNHTRLVFTKNNFIKFVENLKKIESGYELSSGNKNILIIDNCNDQFKNLETVLLSGILKIINAK